MMKKYIVSSLLTLLCSIVISSQAMADYNIANQKTTTSASFVAKRKCVGPCTAGTCPAGYTVHSTSCNCNSSCKCKGNTTCIQPGGGTVSGGRCNGGCNWVFVAPIENFGTSSKKGDQSLALAGFFGPRLETGCSSIL